MEYLHELLNHVYAISIRIKGGRFILGIRPTKRDNEITFADQSLESLIMDAIDRYTTED